MTEWVQTHLPCPCGSSTDAYSINTEGWGKCFSCGKNVNEDKDKNGGPKPVTKTTGPALITDGESLPLGKRRLTKETCEKFGYQVGNRRGKMVQIAPYHNERGQLVAQKIRGADKAFSTTGDFSEVTLFGQRNWGKPGKRVVITEGEIDCMTVSQVQGNKWPVVSLPSGAQSAASAIKRNLEWVMQFDEVVLMFDQDEPGQAAALEVAELLPPGKSKIATLPLKDPNEMLVVGRGQEIMQAVWNAKEYRPDGIVDIGDIIEDIEKPIEMGLPWCFKTLTEKTYGRRNGAVYGFGAGTGVGKTDLFTQQMAYDVQTLQEQVGVIYLEAKPTETGKRLAGKIDGVPYHIPNIKYDKDQLRLTLESLRGKVTFYDSWGDTDWAVIKGKIRYMVVSKGIRLIYLDHLTAMADTEDEKGSLEQIMKEMAGLATELGCIIHFISHLTTPEGKPHEEGGRVTIRHFKGSRAIGFWSHLMIGLERDQQSEDPEERTTTTLRVLKDRYTGQATGLTLALGYNPGPGTLYEKGNQEAKSETCYGFDDESSGVTEVSPPWDSDF